MLNIVLVSGHYPNNVYFAECTRQLLYEYAMIHNYGFYYNDMEIIEKNTGSLHYSRCPALVKASHLYPDADWFVWFDSDVIVNPSQKYNKIELFIDLSDKNILYHVFHEKPWSFPINTGVKIVNKKAIGYEAQMWNIRNTPPWNEFPFEQKALIEYIIPQLHTNLYIIHDPYMLNCIYRLYPTKIENALFIHMCAMNTKERNNIIKKYL